MSEQMNFTITDEKIGQVKTIKKHLDTHHISFSGYIVDAIIDNFENGKWGRLLGGKAK